MVVFLPQKGGTRGPGTEGMMVPLHRFVVPLRRFVVPLRRFALAAVLSGLPSTVHALATGADPLRATRAAGSLVGGGAGAGVVVHVVVSAWWAFVLQRFGVRGVIGGAVAGLLIAALDLEVVGRCNGQVRALPRVPQWLDHVVFGVVVAGRGDCSGSADG